MNDKLLQHFASVVQTPEDVSHLRHLILDMAVRGQLLLQNKTDEAVLTLLKRIAVQKKKSEKNQTKSAKLSSVAKDEGPFPLPSNWEWVQLKEIGNIFHGNSINAVVKKSKYTNIQGGIPYIGTKDVGYGWDVLNYENGISIPKGESKFVVVRKGAVLMCAEGGSAGKKCGITDREICFGNKLVAIELDGGIIPDFVLAVYQTSMFNKMFVNKMTGMIGGVSVLNFQSLIIPLPPLSEQKRIVAIIALCNKLETAMTDLKENRLKFLETFITTA